MASAAVFASGAHCVTAFHVKTTSPLSHETSAALNAGPRAFVSKFSSRESLGAPSAIGRSEFVTSQVGRSFSIAHGKAAGGGAASTTCKVGNHRNLPCNLLFMSTMTLIAATDP